MRTLRLTVLAALGLAIWAMVAVNGAAAAPLEPCNDDRDCSMNESCLRGQCRIGTCFVGQDATCGSRAICAGRPPACQPVQCTKKSQCQAGLNCIGNECVECTSNKQCPVGRSVCSENICVGCTSNAQCGNTYCKNSACARCPRGQRWIQASGVPVCGACVSSRRKVTRACTASSCGVGKVCAEGQCINACGSRLGVDEIERHLDPVPQGGPIPGRQPMRKR